MILWPAPAAAPRATADPIVIAADPPMAPVVTKGSARALAVKVRPSSAATAEPNATQINITGA